MTLISWNGNPIFRGDQVGAEQECCCGCSEECCRTRSYYYDDTVPPGKWFDECPTTGNCVEGEGAIAGDCAGEVIEGHIVERFCKASIQGKEVRAYLRKNSAIDDFGTIAGIDTTQICGVLGVIEADHDITAELEWEDDGIYTLAKVPIRIENSQIGGPLGAAGVVICWCCIDPEDPPPEGEICPCCAGPPPPPPDVCCCVPAPSGGGYPYARPPGDCSGDGEAVIPGDSCWTQFDLEFSASWCGASVSAVLDNFQPNLLWSPSPPWYDERTEEGDNCTRDIVINPPDPETCVLRDVRVAILVIPMTTTVACDPSKVGVTMAGYLQTYSAGFAYRVSDNLFLGSAQPMIKSYWFECNGLDGTVTLNPDLDNTTTGENWCGNEGHYLCDEDDPVLTFTATRTTPPAP